MTDNGNDSNKTLSEKYGLKRYLEISSGSRFLDDIRIGETDASHFRMVFPPETAQAIARDEMDPIAAIVLRTAIVFCSSRGIDFDGMQVGFTNDPERDEPLWERDSGSRCSRRRRSNTTSPCGNGTAAVQGAGGRGIP